MTAGADDDRRTWPRPRESTTHMTHLTRLSLANRLIVGLATLAIVIFGVISPLSRSSRNCCPPPRSRPRSSPRPTRAPRRRSSPTRCRPRSNGPSAASPGSPRCSSTSTNGRRPDHRRSGSYGLDNDKLVGNIRSAVDSVAPTLPDDVETDVLAGSTDDIPVLVLARRLRRRRWTSRPAGRRRRGARTCRRSRASGRSTWPARTPPNW